MDPAETTQFIAPGAATEADRERYRALSGLAAKGVAIVSARQGRWDHAVPVSSYLSVSYDPPTVLVSLYTDGRIVEALETSERFALSVLAEGHRGVANWLASPGNPLVNLLKPVPHMRPDPEGPIVVAGALAWFDCDVVDVHEVATHTLFSGEVRAMGGSSAAALLEGKPDARPLLRFDGRYGTFAD